MANNAQVVDRGSRDMLNRQAIKMWGQLESEAYHEFWDHAKPVDMSNYLEPETTIVPHMIYKDVVLTPNAGRGIIEAQHHLMLNENDVLLASMPKTGSTWVREILYNLFHKDEIDQPLTEPIDLRVPLIEFPQCGLQALAAKPSPRLLKSHASYELLPDGNCDKKYKIIYCIRNPKDTAVSMYHFLKMMTAFQFNGTLTEFLNLWMNDKIFYGPFGHHVLGFWNRGHQNNIHIVRYEDMHKDVKHEIRRLALFLGVEVDDATVDKIAARSRFEKMAKDPLSNHSQWANIENLAKNKDLKFMRKGQVGNWKDHFDEVTQRKFDEWIDKNFGNSDISFHYEM